MDTIKRPAIVDSDMLNGRKIIKAIDIVKADYASTI